MLKCVVISDTHNKHKELKLPEGDVLIHAGDFTSRGTEWEVNMFAQWFISRPHKHKLVIAGNHDFYCVKNHELVKEIFDHDNVTYLFNDYVDIEGYRFWGSPHTPRFHNWAFMRSASELSKVWETIPADTDVVITHGPAYKILDRCYDGREVGCKSLDHRLKQVKPQFHLFGHIHESYGKLVKLDGRTCINASSLDFHYRCVNEPQVFELDKKRKA